jgi:hypothetical protein
MIDAMQMTVSSAIAKRIDDMSSTAARSTWGPRRTRRPWVETDMKSDALKAKRRAILSGSARPVWGLFSAVSSRCGARNQRSPAM